MSDPHKEFEESILNITQYSGSKEAGIKRISASYINSDPLVVYYRYKYGIIDSNRIGANTLGSLLHLGLENLEIENVELEKSIEMEIENDWIISATIDYINFENKTIRDFKVTKRYTYEKFNQDSDYAWQLRMANYILMKNKIIDAPYKMYVSMFLKDPEENYKNKELSTLVYREVDPVPDKEIEAKIKALANEVDSYINGSKKEQCKDLWWRNKKVNGTNTKIPMRCEKYCDYKNNCEFYSKPYNPFTPEEW